MPAAVVRCATRTRDRATASPKPSIDRRPAAVAGAEEDPGAPAPREVVVDHLDVAPARRERHGGGHAGRPGADDQRVDVAPLRSPGGARRSPRGACPARPRAGRTPARPAASPGTPAKSSWWFIPSGKNQSATRSRSVSLDPTTFCASMRIPSEAGTRQVMMFGSSSTRARHPSHAARRHAGPRGRWNLGLRASARCPAGDERHRRRFTPLGDDGLARRSESSPDRAAVAGEA